MTLPEPRRLVYSIIAAYPQQGSDLHVNVGVILGEHATNLYLIERGNQIRMARLLMGSQAVFVRAYLDRITGTAVEQFVDWLIDLHRESTDLIRVSLPATMSAPTIPAGISLLYGQLFDLKAEETAK